jgi:hypothetical protein
MNGAEFFRMIVVTAVGILGITALLGVMRRRVGWDAAEQAGMWLSLEVGIAAVIFSLLPYPLLYSVTDEMSAWRFGSLMMVAYFGWFMIRVGLNVRQFGARFPVMMWLLLVLSGIFSTMEFINAIWWSSIAPYTWGTLWLLALAGIQLIAFVCYDRTPQPKTYPAPRPVSAPTPVQHGVRGNQRTDYSNLPPNHHADDHTQSHRGANHSYRYRDERQVNAYRRALADSTVRVTPIGQQQSPANRNPRP